MKRDVRSGFVDTKELKGLADNHLEQRAILKTLSKETQEGVAQADAAFEEMTRDVFDFESEARVRKAGFTPQQAEDIANMVRTKQVGQIFQYQGKQLVLTPFKTVVPAQTYLTTIQDRVLELTTVPTEIEIAGLKKTINEFTSLSFFGLIKLAITKLLKGRNNG